MSPEQGVANVTRAISYKQAEILNIIARGNSDGSYVDRHQIRNRLSYDPHIQSVHFALRYLFAQGRIEIVGKEVRVSTHVEVNCKTRVYRISELGKLFISTM